MNIFILDKDTKKSAHYHCDKHVVKMILEYAQLLSTAHVVLDDIDHTYHGIYKPTHKNHPCSIWLRQSSDNYQYLLDLYNELSKEYTHRYGKIHKSSVLNYLQLCPKNLKSIGLTDFAQAMPDEYKNSDPVKAYRNYYRGAKTALFSWKNREIPSWILDK